MLTEPQQVAANNQVKIIATTKDSFLVQIVYYVAKLGSAKSSFAVFVASVASFSGFFFFLLLLRFSLCCLTARILSSRPIFPRSQTALFLFLFFSILLAPCALTRIFLSTVWKWRGSSLPGYKNPFHWTRKYNVSGISNRKFLKPLRTEGSHIVHVICTVCPGLYAWYLYL